jgi:ribosome-associated toxin RatA of RatAB toxin-antitoxin module
MIMRSAVAAVLLLSAAGARADDAGDGITVRTEAVAGSSIPTFIIEGVVDAPIENVWDLIVDCGNYTKTMTRIAESQQVSRNGDTMSCRVVADLPFPFSDLSSVTRVTLKVTDDKRVRSWKLVEGDYDVNEGSWTLTRVGDDKTKAVYRLRAVPKNALPDSVTSTFQKRAMPDILRSVRKNVSKKPVVKPTPAPTPPPVAEPEDTDSALPVGAPS